VDGALTPPAESKRASLFRMWPAYVAGLLWIVIAYYLSLGMPGPRGGPGLASQVLGGTLLALPLLLVGYGFWRNRVALRIAGLGRRIGIGSFLVLETFAWLIACIVALFLLMPPYADYSPRARMSENILAMSSFRTEVTERAGRGEKREEIGRGIALPESRWIDFAFVTLGGTALIFNARYGMLAVLEPRYGPEGLAAWSCQGYPRKGMPGSCRDDVAETSLDRNLAGTPAEHARALLDAARKLGKSAVSQRLPPAGPLDTGFQEPDGTAILYSDRHGVLAIVRPDGSCTLYGAEAAPLDCKPGPLRTP
jgi:hypothetical protein